MTKSKHYSRGTFTFPFPYPQADMKVPNDTEHKHSKVAVTQSRLVWEHGELWAQPPKHGFQKALSKKVKWSSQRPRPQKTRHTHLCSQGLGCPISPTPGWWGQEWFTHNSSNPQRAHDPQYQTNGYCFLKISFCGVAETRTHT